MLRARQWYWNRFMSELMNKCHCYLQCALHKFFFASCISWQDGRVFIASTEFASRVCNVFVGNRVLDSIHLASGDVGSRLEYAVSKAIMQEKLHVYLGSDILLQYSNVWQISRASACISELKPQSGWCIGSDLRASRYSASCGEEFKFVLLPLFFNRICRRNKRSIRVVLYVATRYAEATLPYSRLEVKTFSSPEYNIESCLWQKFLLRGHQLFHHTSSFWCNATTLAFTSRIRWWSIFAKHAFTSAWWHATSQRISIKRSDWSFELCSSCHGIVFHSCRLKKVCSPVKIAFDTYLS